MDLEKLIEKIKDEKAFMGGVATWRIMPPKSPKYGEWPGDLHPLLLAGLKKRGVNNLYSHQKEAFSAIWENQNIVVETPTASGKTLCYNGPVLDAILKDPKKRALYLFPTKALAQDQLTELQELIKALDFPIKACTFDGDTGQSARKAIRDQGQIIFSNPDMLHSGILPHHTKWLRLFENLSFVIIDEIHQYRGVFGSHLANIMARLDRIANFYGQKPLYICLSATISNPQELAFQITGKDMRHIGDSGAPSGEKHFILYNPPVVNKELNIRRSIMMETADIAAQFLAHKIPTIIFTRSRLRVEILSTYLRKKLKKHNICDEAIQAYRGGYLPKERRAIEKGLKNGNILGVISTNALELGIDIGSLQISIMAGYPGSIASTLQQAGRAGRKKSTSMAILVASSTPLDQFLLSHPQWFFSASPEQGIIDPSNMIIRFSHLKCACFELPIQDNEQFGGPQKQALLQHLQEKNIVRHRGNRWFWMASSYPAAEISLRSAGGEIFSVVNKSDENNIIAQVDQPSAPMLIHEQAIYIHQGRQYLVDQLDWESCTAFVHEVEVDYFTQAEIKNDIKILDIYQEKGAYSHGSVLISTQAISYKKIKFTTHENLGRGHINLPQQEINTTAWWLILSQEILDELKLEERELGCGLEAIATVLSNILPVFLMCDPRDICSVPMVFVPYLNLPAVFFYDNYPGGVGLSSRAASMFYEIITESMNLLRSCPCFDGCPSCCGPIEEGKKNAILILELMMKKNKAIFNDGNI